MKNVDYYKFFYIDIKMSEEKYYQKHRDVILERAKDKRASKK